MTHMKLIPHSFVLKTVPLLVSLASLIGSVAVSQRGVSRPLLVGAVHLRAPDNRPDLAKGCLLVYSATQ